jgi:hypothetical protein
MKRPKKPNTKIFFTRAQVLELKRCIVGGLDHLQQFLRHVDWDEGLSKAERHKCMSTDRRYEKAIWLLDQKLVEHDKSLEPKTLFEIFGRQLEKENKK